MDDIQTFLWEKANGSKERIEWLKQNYKKAITETDYVKQIQSLPHNHRRATKCRNPGNNRRDYNNLKNKFGFFTSNAKAK